jgi:hypothetical protein
MKVLETLNFALGWLQWMLFHFIIFARDMRSRVNADRFIGNQFGLEEGVNNA